MTLQKVEELFVEIETQIKNYREAETLGMKIYWLDKLKDKALYLNSEIQLFLQEK